MPCLQVDNLSIKMALELHGKLAELIHTDLHVQQLPLVVKYQAPCCISSPYATSRPAVPLGGGFLSRTSTGHQGST